MDTGENDIATALDRLAAIVPTQDEAVAAPASPPDSVTQPPTVAGTYSGSYSGTKWEQLLKCWKATGMWSA